MIGEKNVSITHTHTPVYLDGGITSDKLNRALNIHTTPSFFFFFLGRLLHLEEGVVTMAKEKKLNKRYSKRQSLDSMTRADEWKIQ